MVGNICNPSTRETEVGELKDQGQPGLCSKTLSQTSKNMSNHKTT
jgi:hypothetical protein